MSFIEQIKDRGHVYTGEFDEDLISEVMLSWEKEDDKDWIEI